MWTLKHQDTLQALDDWGLSELKRTLKNQACDTVSFTHKTSSISQSPLFEPQSLLTLYRDGTPWFMGFVTQAPHMGCHQKEQVHYTVKGPWWYLENLVYQQGWWQVDDPSKENPQKVLIHKGRVILGQDISGKTLTCKEQIKDILNYAITCGAPIQVGTIDHDFTIPLDEVKDLSCAEALHRILRWAPDSVTYFDYSSIPYPTLHIRKRTQCPSLALEIEAGDIAKLSITPRHDLQVPEVVLKYEKTHHLGKYAWTTTEIDAYPQGSQGKSFKALVLTLEILGARSTLVQQKITTQTIQPHSPQWWRDHMPELQNIPLDSMHIGGAQRSSNLPQELIEGTIAPWMNAQVEEDVIRALVSYETDTLSVSEQPVSVRVLATDASSNVFRKALASTPEEPTPFGLAKELYDSLSPLHFEGSVTQYLSKTTLGQCINIQGGHPLWENMHALLQEIKEDVDNHKSTLSFGPPKHLGNADLIELLRMNRKRSASHYAPVRTSGTSPYNSFVEQGYHTRIGHSGALQGHYKKLTFKNPKALDAKLVIDADTLEKDMLITLREEDVCDNGELKKRIILSSQPFKEEDLL